MRVYLASRVIPRETLAQVIDAFAVPEGALAWMRWPHGARLAQFSSLRPEVEGCETGRVFWGDGELRWQTIERGVRVVFVGDRDLAPEDFDREAQPSEHADQKLLLQDVKVIDATAMPPLTGEARWALIRRTYQTVGQGVFERFAGAATMMPERGGAHDADG